MVEERDEQNAADDVAEDGGHDEPEDHRFIRCATGGGPIERLDRSGDGMRKTERRNRRCGEPDEEHLRTGGVSGAQQPGHERDQPAREHRAVGYVPERPLGGHGCALEQRLLEIVVEEGGARRHGGEDRGPDQVAQQHDAPEHQNALEDRPLGTTQQRDDRLQGVFGEELVACQHDEDEPERIADRRGKRAVGRRRQRGEVGGGQEAEADGQPRRHRRPEEGQRRAPELFFGRYPDVVVDLAGGETGSRRGVAGRRGITSSHGHRRDE